MCGRWRGERHPAAGYGAGDGDNGGFWAAGLVRLVKAAGERRRCGCGVCGGGVGKSGMVRYGYQWRRWQREMAVWSVIIFAGPRNDAQNRSDFH